MTELSSSQKEGIKRYFDGFEDFLNTDEGRKWKQGREDREVFFGDSLAESKLDSLAEEDFKRVISTLWASDFWGNKEYLTGKIIQSNGLANIKVAFKELLYGSKPLTARYDTFRAKIKGIGPSMLTEILSFVSPERYCIWNEKPKNVIPFLGIGKMLPDKVYKYQIDVKQYLSCIEVLGVVREELRTIIKEPDFIDVDFFLAYIFYEIMPRAAIIPPESRMKIEEVEPTLEAITSHTDSEAALLELGKLLGFDTYITAEDSSKEWHGQKLREIATLREMPAFTYQRLLDTVKHIDAIWFRDEFPAFCFEVEHSTDVTKGLLRLYQISKLDAGFLIIGPPEVKTKFQTEVSKDPFYSIRHRFQFKSYDELSKFFELARKYHSEKANFLGE